MPLIHQYSFDPGFRFSDYVQGDKLAGYGIAALVGTAAGATIAKTVGFGAILLLFKEIFHSDHRWNSDVFQVYKTFLQRQYADRSRQTKSSYFSVSTFGGDAARS